MASTGANKTPLGRINPLLGSGKKPPVGISLLNPKYMESENGSGDSSANGKRDNDSDSESAQEARRKKKRSRWAVDDGVKAFIPGMPTVLPSNLDKDQEACYLLQLQIEEASRRLRSGDLGISPNPEERSPSPEPIYNNEGKRLNTREYRTRKKLEDDRHALITQMIKLNREYKPPPDYKPPLIKVNDKVMIPQDEHPEINFVGLLIGPRGNTLKSMEKETGAKIIIRGKGSVKEGKVGRKDGQPLPGEDEPLHAYVTASNPESVKKAVDKIKEIIRQGVEVPEGQNDLRRMQLRELALLNGTLRENDGPRCNNCGASDHKAWQCPDKPNVTNNVICTNCGGAGHIAKDCRQRRPGTLDGASTGGDFTLSTGIGGDRAKIDEEYMSLMAELGEGPPPNKDLRSDNRGSGAAANYRRPGLFDRPQAPPRAIMAPTPASRPPGPGTVPGLQTSQQSPMPSPWSTQPPPPPTSQQQQQQNKSNFMGLGGVPVLSQPPPTQPWQQQQPPQIQQQPPQIQQQQQPPQMLQQQQPGGAPHAFTGLPPPNLLHAPPPPPPVSQNASTGSNPPPWQQQPPPTSHTTGPPPISPWQNPSLTGPPPTPVPPPRPGAPPPSVPPPNMSYPWQQQQQQGFVGMPPPPPPQQQQQQPQVGGGIDLNMLAQAGLPSLLAAPPPPPPS